LPAELAFFVCDGGKTGQETTLMNKFVDESNKPYLKSKHTVTVIYSEESVVNRLKIKRRTTAGALQAEKMYIVTGKAIEIEDKARLALSGTTVGEHISCAWRSWSDPSHWTMKRKHKATIITKKDTIANGGRGPGHDEEEERKAEKEEAKAITPESEEQVFWWAPPPTLQDEWIHNFNLRAVVDLTPGDGARAMCCIKNKIPYVAICFNQENVDALYDHLFKETMKESLNEGCKQLYSSELAAVVVDSQKAKTEESGTDTADKKKGAKNKTGSSGGSKDGGKDGGGSGASGGGSKDPMDRSALVDRIRALAGGPAAKRRKKEKAEDDAAEGEDGADSVSDVEEEV
jgi:uncharacterized membrane protein YgcG